MLAVSFSPADRDTICRIERLNGPVTVEVVRGLERYQYPSECGSQANLITDSIVLFNCPFSLIPISFLVHDRLVDSEGEEKDNSQTSQPSNNSTSSAGRNSSVYGRRPIRSFSQRSVNSSSNGDDGDDKDENPNHTKLKAQCENEDTVLLNISDAEDDGNQTTDLKLPITKPQSNSTHIYPGPSYMNIREMSFMKGISRVWDLARNVSGFNTTQSNTPADLNVSVGSLIGDLPELPDITLTFSPKVTNIPKTGDRPSSPIFLTPPSNIPVSRIKTLEYDSQITMDDISPIRVSPRNRKRSKSESSYRQDPYYIPTPSALLKRRLKEKVSLERTGIFNETPCNRKRHNSEPTVSLSPSPESQKLNYSFSQGQIGCSRLRETGLFNCQTRENGYLHLQNDFLELNKPFRLNKQNITVSIEKALSSDLAKTEDSNIEITLGFCPEEVDRFTRLSVRDQHSQRLTEEKSLLYLLGQMNRHMSKVTSCDQSFNGLKITGMADRSKRLQLDDDDGYPLGSSILCRSRYR